MFGAVRLGMLYVGPVMVTLGTVRLGKVNVGNVRVRLEVVEVGRVTFGVAKLVTLNKGTVTEEFEAVKLGIL